jgi:hypothetical protein
MIVLLGVPFYLNAAGVIPIVSALMEKGASLGTVLAFIGKRQKMTLMTALRRCYLP